MLKHYIANNGKPSPATLSCVTFSPYHLSYIFATI
nr:MAG TPA: hypothetical protein [Bacteriophage sp.]